MAALAHPELYFSDAEGRVWLKGMTCTCGWVAFPRQSLGCERCGVLNMTTPTDLPARGRVAAVVCVHLHPMPYPKTPFTIGAVRLESGAMVRAFLADAGLRPGDPVVAEFEHLIGESGEQLLDLRFVASSH